MLPLLLGEFIPVCFILVDTRSSMKLLVFEGTSYLDRSMDPSLKGSDPYGVEMQEDRSRFQWLQQLAEEAALGELDPRKGPGLSRSCYC